MCGWTLSILDTQLRELRHLLYKIITHWLAFICQSPYTMSGALWYPQCFVCLCMCSPALWEHRSNQGWTGAFWGQWQASVHCLTVCSHCNPSTSKSISVCQHIKHYFTGENTTTFQTLGVLLIPLPPPLPLKLARDCPISRSAGGGGNRVGLGNLSSGFQALENFSVINTVQI